MKILVGCGIAILLATAVARPASRPVRPQDRCSGALRSVAHVLWLKVSGRIAFLTRVHADEAALNERVIRTVMRIDPENTEAPRYGALGLMAWGHPERSFPLLADALRRHPKDPGIMRMIVDLSLLADTAIGSARETLELATRRWDRPLPEGDRSVAMLWIVGAQRAEAAGDTAAAAAMWDELARREPEPWARARAARESARIRNGL